MEINFLFSVDQKVTTPFGDAGIVSMLGVDDGGKKYFVKTKECGNWFTEAQLTSAE